MVDRLNYNPPISTASQAIRLLEMAKLILAYTKCTIRIK